MQKPKHIQWNYGPLTSTLYDLTEINSWGEDMSFLELVVSPKKQEAHQIPEQTPVKQLVSFKWKKYGQWYFYVLGALYPLYIICYVHCPLKLHNTIFQQKPLQKAYVTHRDTVWLVRELVTILGTVVIPLLEILGVFSAGASCHLGQTVLCGLFHVTVITYACMVLVNTKTWLSNTNGEMVPMPVALVPGWCRTEDPANLGQFYHYPMALFNTFQLFLTIMDGPANYEVNLPFTFGIIYFVFAVIATLLMLNLFITMKDDTHGQVVHERDKLWKAQRRLLRFLCSCSGICRCQYGLGHHWFLQDKNHHDQNPLWVLHYVEAFKGSDKEHEQEQLSEKQPSDSVTESGTLARASLTLPTPPCAGPHLTAIAVTRAGRSYVTTPWDM
ncbi:hypothetical protein GH733_003225 [Mirounga leonina]|nr:hypothetical protein GH733_003225 [Mirounga leonina]